MKTHRMTYHTRTANWLNLNGNLWDLRHNYRPKTTKSQLIIHSCIFVWTNKTDCYRIVHDLRAWYNGSTSASQAEDEGSIPFARTKNTADPCGRIYFWPVALEANPTRGFGTQRQRSERGPTKSPRAFAIGLILYGNYTFPSPAPG